MKPPVTYTPASADEIRALKAIARCTYPVGCFHKRFANQMAGATELTDKQRVLLWAMTYRYRRQIPDKQIVALAADFNAVHARGGQIAGSA